MRRLIAIGLSVVVVGCTDSTSGPTGARPGISRAPRLTSSTTACDQSLLASMQSELTGLYANAPSDGTNVLAQLSSINKACLSDRPSTQNQVNALVQFVLRSQTNGQLVDPDVGGLTLTQHVANVINSLYVFSTFNLAGAGVATPTSAVTVTTVDGNAGISVPAGAVSQEIVIIITPLPDNTTLPNDPYTEYPPAVDITTSIGPITFAVPATIGICEDPSVPDAVEPNLRIAHGLTSSTELLPLAPPPSFLACYGPLASTPIESPRFDPHHLGSSARRLFAWAGHHVGRVLMPATAYAIHGGLGGLTSSLSPFKPVDVGSVPIAFASDRDGATYIYTMNPDGTNQVRVGAVDGLQKTLPVWSPDRSKIAFQGFSGGTSHVYVMNADGTGIQQLTNSGTTENPEAWSSDGTKILFHTNRDGNDEIYVMNADGTGAVNLTNNPALDAFGSLSPDGSKVAFASNRGGNWRIWVMDSNGSNVQQLTTSVSPVVDSDVSWSPTGGKIAFVRWNGVYDIWTMNADGTNQVQKTSGAGSNRNPTWNPQGTRIAFESTRDGPQEEIYVMNPNGTGQTRLTNNAARDVVPRWW